MKTGQVDIKEKKLRGPHMNILDPEKEKQQRKILTNWIRLKVINCRTLEKCGDIHGYEC